MAGPATGPEPVTVVSFGLGASRRPRARVLPPGWTDVLSLYERTVTRIVTEYGGTVLAGDGGDIVTARFGEERQAEGTGRDAVAAALDVLRAVDRLSATVPAPFGVGDLRARAGVHTASEPEERTAEEAAPSQSGPRFASLAAVASHLRVAAGPGEVLLSDAAGAAAAGFFELAVVPIPDGPDAPATAYRVLRRRPTRGRQDGRPLIPFVSRQRELAWLDRHWRAAAGGPTRSVLVVGDPGMGKSRLVFEFAAAVASTGGRVLTLLCRRPNALTPLHPFGPLMGAVPQTPDAAAGWLQACAGFGPTLVVVEDAHWADPSTLEVVDRLNRLDLSILVVLTVRPEPLQGPQNAIDPARRLVVDRLPATDARSVIDLVLGGEQLSEDLIDELLERADGVPLYLEELARNVSAQDPGDRSALPSTLAEVITARLDRLGETRSIAQLASVIGREFDQVVLRALCDLDDDALDKHVWRLTEHAIVDPPQEPGGALCFRHALIHQAAYQSLTPAERRRAHSFVADTLAGAGRADTEPQLAAHHLTAGGRYGEAVAMWRNAARAARRHSRFREAAGHEREIIALLPHLEEDHRDSVELKARSRLAMCLTAVDQGAPEILGEATRAQDLARAYGDERTVLDTYLILLPWWQARAEYAAIEAALPEVRRLGAQLGDPSYGYSLAMVEASVRIWQGCLTDGLGQLGEMFERVGIPLRDSLRLLPQVSAPTVLMRCSSRVAAALGFWLTGDARSAWRLVDDALLFAIERGVSAAQAVTCATAALIAQLDGDRARAAGFATQAEHAPAETATVQWRRWGAALHRWAEGDPGQIEVPGLMLRPYFLMLVSDDESRPPHRTIQLLDEAVGTARATGERFCEPELLRERARAWHRAGRVDRAAADLEEATDLARSQLARSLEMRVLTERVRLLGDGPARARLAQLVESLGVDGPARSTEEAARALGRS